MMLGPVTAALSLLAFFSTITMAAPIPQAPPITSSIVLSGTSLTVAPIANATVSTTASATASAVSAVNSTSAFNATTVTPPASSSGKLVVAHYMMGNAYSATVASLKNDIALAQSASIDGFALNVGSDSWQPGRVTDFYTAASGTSFKLFMSFDMTVLPGDGAGDADLLKNYITSVYDHPNQLKVNGKSLVSTFSGENSFFGQGSANAGWQFVFNGVGAVEFMPSFFSTPAASAAMSVVDGVMNWNGGWLTAATTADVGAQPEESKIIAIANSFDADMAYINPLVAAGKTYLATVAGTFFTHYGADSYNKNWLYNEDYSAYARRWDTVIANRDKTDIVEIITWNDYGESSYIGPIGVDQPNSQAWVDGFDHTSILPLTAYYAQAFKTGTYPSITKDQVFIAARPHTYNASPNDPVGQPTNWDTVVDDMFVDVLCTAPSTVVLATGDGKSQTFQVPAGASHLSMPLTVGGYLEATIQRDGATVVNCKPTGYTFTDSPPAYNFNFFMGGC
ncbi:hypothetical protein FRB96_001100 [Tulasnella sp. 330]|nr:hypothetical protein FRB96_001100 [Tulasnella sp. 330]KAG8881456.1 hypothetical protein FRB98_004356 [Tulasnella sp. 332]